MAGGVSKLSWCRGSGTELAMEVASRVRSLPCCRAASPTRYGAQQLIRATSR